MATTHIVEQGECLSKIALKYGFVNYKLIYNHPKNEAFRRKRPDPNVIYPGDSIYIPDKVIKEEDRATGRTHVFQVPKRKRVLRLRILDAEGKPARNESVELTPEGQAPVNKSTDGKGIVEFPVPVEARGGDLKLGQRKLRLDFSHLNPVRDAPDEGISGIQARLLNLGYYNGPITDKLDRPTRIAIALFQRDLDLEMDGIPGEATVKRLIEEHGC